MLLPAMHIFATQDSTRCSCEPLVVVQNRSTPAGALNRARRADAIPECVLSGVESLERLSAMPRLRMHLEHYDESHRKWGNKLLHFVGIPLLLVSSLGLLSKLSLHTGSEMPALRPSAGWIALI